MIGCDAAGTQEPILPSSLRPGTPSVERKGLEGVWGRSGEFGEGGVTRTDLQLPLDPPFAAFTEVHLRLVVFGHHLHKLAGEDGVLWGQGQRP